MYEFKVIPAPTRGKRAKGIKKAEDRFALALEAAINELATEGWEFLRTETLPSEEKSGLTSTITNFRSVMVFRRPRDENAKALQPRLAHISEDKEQSLPEADNAEASNEDQPKSLPAAFMERVRSVTPGVKLKSEDDETSDDAK